MLSGLALSSAAASVFLAGVSKTALHSAEDDPGRGPSLGPCTEASPGFVSANPFAGTLFADFGNRTGVESFGSFQTGAFPFEAAPIHF